MKRDDLNITHVSITERGIEIRGTRAPRRIGNVPESLDRFRTVAFGTVHAFIDDLNREIWATVAPIMPGEDVDFDAGAWGAAIEALAPGEDGQEERNEQQRSPRDIAHAWFMLGARCGTSADGELLQDLFVGSWEEHGEEGPDE